MKTPKRVLVLAIIIMDNQPTIKVSCPVGFVTLSSRFIYHSSRKSDRALQLVQAIKLGWSGIVLHVEKLLSAKM